MTSLRGRRGQERVVVTSVVEVTVGDHDPMSRDAVRVGLPLCGRRGCTRAIGHHEAETGHPARRHVVALAPDYIARIVLL